MSNTTKATVVTSTAKATPAEQTAATVLAYVTSKPSARVALITGLNVRLGASFKVATDLTGTDASRAEGIATVQHIMATIQACTDATAKVTPEKVTVSPLVVVAQRVADLRLAADLLEQGIVSPTDLDDAPATSTDAFGLVLPYAAGTYATAATIGSAKVTRSTTRTDIAEVFAAAFADLPSGAYLTSTQIGVNGGHVRGGLASGAINARLYPRNGSQCSLVGFVPVTDGRVQGATKA